MKRIYAREDVCIGCRLCEIHCTVAHSKSKDIIKAFKKEKEKALPRVTVEERKPVSFAVQCRHCDQPACVNACMTGAMQKDPESGIVLCDQERCVGCWMCLMVCQYGAVKAGENGKKYAVKCDLCIESGKPACVENCPNLAIVYEER